MKKGICLNPSFRPWRDPHRLNPDGWWDPVRGPGLIDTELPILRRLGTAILRIEFPWWAIEKTAKGAFDWHRADLIVSRTVATGLELAPVLVFTPAWATLDCSNPATDCRTSRHLPTCPAQVPNPRDFRDFVLAVAGRYRGRIGFWELWNEPDLPNYFAGTARDYGRSILAPGYAAVKEADPSAQVLLGGPSQPDGDWIASAIAAAGGKVDIVTFHNYSGARSARAGAKVVARLAPGKPVWLGEFGCEQSSKQADLIGAVFGRECELDAAIWYELRDDDIASVNGACGAQTFGLLDRHYRPKPSFDMFQRVPASG